MKRPIDVATDKLLAAFSREWIGGPEVHAKIKAFAKHNKVSKAHALWLIIVHQTALMGDPDHGGVNGDMGSWMDAWHKMERESRKD